MSQRHSDPHADAAHADERRPTAADVCDAIDAEIDACLALHLREPRAALLGAALRGDRAGMSDAAERLAGLDRDATASGVLARCFQHVYVVATTRYGDSPGLAFDVSELEQLPLERLQELTHRAAVLAYAPPSSPQSRAN